MSPSVARSILVVGGGGYFGKILVQELLRFTDRQILVGGRSGPRLSRFCESLDDTFKRRIQPVLLDLENPDSIQSALERVFVAICAAGPFQQLPLTLPTLCLRKGIHYIDLADDGSFIKKVHALVRENSDGREIPLVCTGWSTVPALSGLLARIAKEGLDVVDSIDIQIAPGNRVPRSRTTIEALLAAVNQPFAWSKPRPFQFPLPVGPRVGYLVDVSLDLFPQVFRAPRIDCRVGLEFSFLNKLFFLVAHIVQGGGLLSRMRWASWLHRGSQLVGFLGHDWGAVGVEAIGKKGGRQTSRKVCIIAEHFGQCISVMPAVVMTTLLLEGRVNSYGLVPIDGWLTQDQLESACGQRGYRLVIKEYGI